MTKSAGTAGAKRFAGGGSRSRAQAKSKRAKLVRALAKVRLVRRAKRAPRCRVLALRPGQARGKASKEPLVAARWRHWLPHWIALHAERGPRRKCWEGHGLQPDLHDGRRYS